MTKTLTFDSKDYEQALNAAQELHDNGYEVGVEMHTGKITITYKEDGDAIL